VTVNHWNVILRGRNVGGRADLSCRLIANTRPALNNANLHGNNLRGGAHLMHGIYRSVEAPPPVDLHADSNRGSAKSVLTFTLIAAWALFSASGHTVTALLYQLDIAIPPEFAGISKAEAVILKDKL
jgi:hypothetical protein